MRSQYPELQQRIAGHAGVPMFWASLTFLVCLACLIVLWVDMPNLQEKAAEAFGASPTNPSPAVAASSPIRTGVERTVLWLLLVIWPIVITESVFHWFTRPWDKQTRKYHGFALLFCLCPALRMCARSPELGERLWIPGLGWRKANKRLRRRLERQFSVPMILIALMIMPILIIEFFLKAQVAQYAWLRLLLHIGTGVIWFAFAFEFILMVSVAEKKLAYCKQHWIDLAIILLPLFSFLRSLRVLRATRAAKLMKIPQITKMVRVYRLRGTAVKAIQALILLEFFQRLFGVNPERAIGKLQARLEEVEREAKLLRRKIIKLEREKAAQQEADLSAEAAKPTDASPAEVSLKA
jgi:voltage-gated potassium channel